MALTRRQLLYIDNALAGIEHLPGDPLFVLAVAQLRAHLEPWVQAIRERGLVPEAVSQAYLDYDAARLALCDAHAQRDAQGHALRDDRGHLVMQSPTAFEQALRAVQQDPAYAEAYAAVEAQKRAWEVWADGEATEHGGTLPCLPFDRLPPQITPQYLRPLLPVLTNLPPTTPAAP